MFSPSKYKAVKTTVDGIVFDSKKEAKRYQELKILQKAGIISGLRLQPEYEVSLMGQKICKYRGDFWYVDTKTEGAVIEDVKGMKTPVYRLKKKLVEAYYGIKIIEV
jgi:hypothetical protein